MEEGSAIARTRLRAENITHRRPAVTAFIVVYCAALIVTFSQAPRPFYYDAANYWSLGTSFFRSGHFSLLNFHDSLRGYLFPLVLHFLAVIAGGLGLSASSVVKLWGALMLSLIATVFVPKLAELAWPERRWSFPKRVALALVLGVFWVGHIAYPLTDMPAVAAVLLAIVAVARSDSPMWMFVAGAACAAAINLRPAYVLVAPAIAVLTLMSWFPERRFRGSIASHGLAVAAAIVGFAIVSLPQVLAMHRHFGTWNVLPGSQAGLASLQYTDGLRYQRYDTYIGPGEPDPHPQMMYIDPAGLRLLAQNGDVIKSTSQYVHLVLNHPITMLGSFGRHAINGLDQRYNTPYVENREGVVYSEMRVAGFAFAFLALLRVLWPAARRMLGRARWRYAIALAVCGLSALPSAVETRFMISIALLAYALVVAAPYPKPLRAQAAGGRRFVTPVMIAAGLLAFGILVLHVVNGATAHLQFA